MDLRGPISKGGRKRVGNGRQRGAKKGRGGNENGGSDRDSQGLAHISHARNPEKIA